MPLVRILRQALGGKMSGQRIRAIPPLRRDPETGQAICRHWDCTKPVGKGRRSWCGPECVHDALMQSNQAYARSMVEKRDHGICAVCGTDTKEIRKQMASYRGILSWARTDNRIGKHFGLTGHEVWQAVQWASWKLDCEYQAHKAERLRLTVTYTPPEPALEEIDPEEALAVERFFRRFEKMVRAAEKAFTRNLYAMGYDRGRRSYWDMDHVTEVVRGGSNQLENLQTLCQPCHKAKTAKLAAERALERSGQPCLPGIG